MSQPRELVRSMRDEGSAAAFKLFVAIGKMRSIERHGQPMFDSKQSIDLFQFRMLTNMVKSRQPSQKKKSSTRSGAKYFRRLLSAKFSIHKTYCVSVRNQKWRLFSVSLIS